MSDVETKFLTVRGVEDSVAREFSAGAAVRGINQSEYLRRLLQLRLIAGQHLSRPVGASEAEKAAHFEHLTQWMNDLNLWDQTA